MHKLISTYLKEHSLLYQYLCYSLIGKNDKNCCLVIACLDCCIGNTKNLIYCLFITHTHAHAKHK